MANLPEFVAFKSKVNAKYLQFVRVDGELHEVLRFSGEEALSPYTKFQVEVSKSDQNLVHIRSCYNNKYWATNDVDRIVAKSDEPQEDRSDSSCTLLRPCYVDSDSSTVLFIHVNRDKYVVMIDDVSQAIHACLCPIGETEDPNSLDAFTVVDWSSLVRLPRNVAFRGGEERKFLSARAVGGTRYLQFVADDVADPTVGHEIFTTGDGHVSVKSEHYGKFWTRTMSSWVLADTSENGVSNNVNALFSPTIIEENVVVLLSLGNNNYCKSISSTDIATKEPIIALSAADAVITKLSQLEVVERVTNKKVEVTVEDVHVGDLRVVVPTLVSIVAGDAINSGDSDKEMEVKLNYDAESLTRTWSSTFNGSLEAGVKVDIRSPIPVEVNGEVTMSGLTVGDLIWGEDLAKSQTPVEISYKVTVPARTTATVHAMGRKRLWDIPFSYTQTNTFPDGTKTSFKMDDGIYRGTHTLFEEYKVEFAPIS